MGVETIEKPEAMGQFLELSSDVYHGDNFYCAQPPDAVLSSIFRSDFEGRQRIAVIKDSGSIQGRSVARISPSLKDESGSSLGMIGFFEAHDNPGAVKELIADQLNWLSDAGAGQVVGPMNGDTWHKYRLNSGPFDNPPFLMEPYNKPYYEKLWLECGFSILEEYYSLHVDNVSGAEANTKKFADRIKKRGFKLRRLERKQLERELGIIYRISTEIFSQNYLYTPITLADFLSLYSGVNSILDRDFVWFVQSPKGEDIGFVFAFPDRLNAVQSMRGKRNLPAKLRFLLNRNKTSTINLKSLGVLPGYQGTGVALALVNQVYSKAIERGFTRTNLCLIKEGNSSGRMDGGEGKILRKYRLYSHG